jgi:hypothetical protein
VEAPRPEADALAALRERSQAVMAPGRPNNRVVAGAIVALWLLLAALRMSLLARLFL